MSERKVLNKYFPWDFDPTLMPKRKSIRGKQIKVRVMLPCTVCCNTCGEFVYRGKKFNARMERLEDTDYCGIKIFRFYIKCTRCSQEIIIKTDPEHADYIVEGGAVRAFEPWKQKQQQDEAKEQALAEDEDDSMKALENRTEASRRELERADQLEEIRDLVTRGANISTDYLLSNVAQTNAEREAQILRREKEEARAAFQERQNTEPVIKRLDSDSGSDVDESRSLLGKKRTSLFAFGPQNDNEDENAGDSKETSMSGASGPACGVMIKKKKKDKKKKKKKKKHKKQKTDAGGALAGLLGGTTSSDDE